MKRLNIIFSFLVCFLLMSNTAKADFASFVYFTGIGCPHCAKLDPVLLKDFVRNKDILIIEYEIYQQRINSPLMLSYNPNNYMRLGVPYLVFKKDKTLIGDGPIREEIEKNLKKYIGNKVVLPKGKTKSFENLDLNELKGEPKIWYKNKIAIKKPNRTSKETANSERIKMFLLLRELPEGAKEISPKDVALSGGSVSFKKAYDYKNWILQYN